MRRLYWLIFRLRLWAGRKLLPRRYPETAEEWYVCYPRHRVYADQIGVALNRYFPGATYDIYIQSYQDGPAWERHLAIAVLVDDYSAAQLIYDRFCDEWWYDYSKKHKFPAVDVTVDWRVDRV